LLVQEGTHMKQSMIRMSGGGGDGGDKLPGEPWPGPEEPPSPDGGPRNVG
jgi:hypothetical protein